MIVDSHIHYWQPNTPERPWDPGGSNLGAEFPVEDLLRDASAAGVDAVVDITPSMMGDDNRYAFEGARDERVAAVFARLGPRGEGDEERLRALAARPKFAGLRYTFFGPAERAWIEDGSLDRILTLAEELGLLTALFLPQPRELARIIERHPGSPILIDHMAVDHRPVHRDPTYDAFAAWSDVPPLAKFPNAYVKISNVPELSRRPFPYDDLTSRLREIYDAFGPDRVIWGSNYPPSKAAATYADSVRYVHELPFMSAADKAKFMGGTMTALLDRARARPGTAAYAAGSSPSRSSGSP
jgi:predicted TIM-barrel fold metal-dependent hydrolase